MVINNNMKTYAYNRVIRKVLIFFMLFFSYVWITNAEMIPTISSTSIWGNWNSASTWVEWKIPTENDIIQINWKVSLTSTVTVWGIQITWSGVLSSLCFLNFNKKENYISI